MRNRLLLGAALFTIAAGAWGHHGWNEYDSNTVLKVTGTIERFVYEEPHGLVELATPSKTWLVVLAPPARMENRGLTPEMLELGNQATVEGYPSRNNPEEMRAERITINGKTVELR